MIIVGNDSSVLDNFIAGKCCKTDACKQLQKLNFDSLKRLGATVVASSEKEFKIEFKGQRVSASKVRNVLANFNPEMEIRYSDVDEEDPLINKTDKPIWSLKKAGNAFILSKGN